MRVVTFAVGPLGCNCSIVYDEVEKRAIVIDPGGDYDDIVKELRAADLTVSVIVHTHTHIDHVGATAPLSRWSGAEALIHEDDRVLYEMLPVQAAMLGMTEPERCDVRGSLVDGQALSAGSLEVGIIHTPGHTPGSVSFVAQAEDRPLLFSGDTLFRGGIGRTDLWGGDSTQIMRSLSSRILTLADETLVIPGHGPATTIGDERRFNPFLAR